MVDMPSNQTKPKIGQWNSEKNVLVYNMHWFFKLVSVKFNQNLAFILLLILIY